MLNYTNELALPNISDFTKHREEEVHDGGVVKGTVICHDDLSQEERSSNLIQKKKAGKK